MYIHPTFRWKTFRMKKAFQSWLKMDQVFNKLCVLGNLFKKCVFLHLRSIVRTNSLNNTFFRFYFIVLIVKSQRIDKPHITSWLSHVVYVWIMNYISWLCIVSSSRYFYVIPKHITIKAFETYVWFIIWRSVPFSSQTERYWPPKTIAMSTY